MVSLGLSFSLEVLLQDQSNIILNEGRLNIGARAKDYNIVFGQAVLDFSDVSLEELDKKIELNTVFGSAEIVLPKDAAVEIKAIAFSSTRLPDGTNLSFGDRTYLSDPQGKGQADFTLEINTVFGSTEIRH